MPSSSPAVDPLRERLRRALPAWFRQLSDAFRTSREGTVALDDAGDALARRASAAVWAAAEMELEGRRHEARGARRALEELGLGPQLEAAVTRLRCADRLDRGGWDDDPVTEVGPLGPGGEA